MQKPNNFDNTKAYTEYMPLPPGGYICKVIDIAEMQSKTGKEMVKIALDVAEGEYAGKFKIDFDADAKEDKKWPCVAYQLTLDNEGNTNRGFKSLIDSLEDSNKGFSVEWGDNFCKPIKGKLLGVTFGREQYEGNDGTPRWSVRVKNFKSVQDIKDGKFKVPADKYLEKAAPTNPVQDFEELDEDLPF